MMLAAANDLACPRRAPAVEGCFRRSALSPLALRRHRLRCVAHAAPHAASTLQPSRRDALLAGFLLAAGSAMQPPSSQAVEAEAPAVAAAPAADASGEEQLVLYSSASQGYTLLRPASWEQVGKAGADSLFRDPSQKSTTVGVTAYPVTIASLEQFGDLQTAGERLLAAERAKESTLSVAMVSQVARTNPGSGATTYDFEYELDSTRGRKRVLSTVTVYNRKLYIANGNVSCGKKESCSSVQETLLPLVRRATQSLTVGAGIS